MNPALIAVAIAEVPAMINYFRRVFLKHNPDAPEPTDAEVLAAFESAFASSVARDEQWLAAHPEV